MNIFDNVDKQSFTEGPLSTTISTPCHANWVPVQPDYWVNGDEVAVLDGDQVRQSCMLRAVKGSLKAKSWAEAAHHDAGQGLEEGV